MDSTYYILVPLTLWGLYIRIKDTRAAIKTKDSSRIKGSIFFSALSLIILGLIIWHIESGS